MPIYLTIISAIFILVNFIAYLIQGSIITNKKLWNVIQIWTVVFLPVYFLFFIDSNSNECCGDSAFFSPEHRVGIYTLIVISIIAFIISLFRKSIFPPVAELLLSIFLISGLIVNILFCIHLATIEFGSMMGVFGNLPVLLLFLMMMAENQKLLKQHIEVNILTVNSMTGRFCNYILKHEPLFKYTILALLLVPIVILLSLFLILFGQKPDSIIRAFTDTYHHGFSQLDYLCDNVQCGGHFLCSVGANGHVPIVKPFRYGERNGRKIICNRQLLISNAFEQLLQEKVPRVHKYIRQNYNKVGNSIHRHYHLFSNKIISDIVYLLMKPLELMFLFVLYTFDQRPENRIATQYLRKDDREKIDVLQSEALKLSEMREGKGFFSIKNTI